jgi:hypothetical protein
MVRVLLRVLLAVGLVALGWAGGLAQSRGGGSQFFTLTVTAPAGDTAVHCRNCEFVTWVDGQGTASHEQQIRCAGPLPCVQSLNGRMRGPLVIAAAGATTRH